MKFNIESGPHIKSENDTKKIMTRLLIALMPIVCFGIFKNVILVNISTDVPFIKTLNPVFMLIVGMLTSYITELLYMRYVLKKKDEILKKEMSKSFSIIPGLFIALVLPVTTPLWVVAFGAFTGTIIGKMLFGGFGNNIFNPALIGYLLISVSYSSLAGNYLNLYELDAIATATPLTNLASLNYYGTYESIVGVYGSLFNFLSGTIPGALGEVSKILIIFAFIYLALTKTIKWRIPLTYILTVFVMTLIIGYTVDLGAWYSLFHVLSGGLLFGAVFMATDPVTTPITNVGQIFFGVSLGILTVVLRFLTPYPEGVMTSILFMNLLVFIFDKIGLKLKYNLKNIYIPIITFVIISGVSILLISNKLNDAKNSISEKDDIKSVEIISKTDNNGITTYTVSSKGWGVIKAEVKVEGDTIKSIDITDSSGETQWSEIEKYNYVFEVINNQDNIEELDAISGSTRSSEALKNIVRKILKENENE